MKPGLCKLGKLRLRTAGFRGTPGRQSSPRGLDDPLSTGRAHLALGVASDFPAFLSAAHRFRWAAATRVRQFRLAAPIFNPKASFGDWRP